MDSRYIFQAKPRRVKTPPTVFVAAVTRVGVMRTESSRVRKQTDRKSKTVYIAPNICFWDGNMGKRVVGQAKPRFEFCVYIANHTLRSDSALERLKKICEENGSGRLRD